MATDNQGDVVLQETYYSVGGGFALSKVEMDMSPPETSLRSVPYISKKQKKCCRCRKHRANLSRKRNQNYPANETRK